MSARLLGRRVGEKDVEQPDGALLVERVVLVAALRRLDARRAAVGAAARRGWSRGWRPARLAAAAKPRALMPAPPGWPSYTKTVSRPVSAWWAVETPPMSQRSQVAKSGSSPIEQCSAAWAAPGQVGGERGRSRRARRRGASTRRPGCARVCTGQVERHLVDHVARRAGGGGGRTPPGGRPRPCRGEIRASPQSAVLDLVDEGDVGELAGGRGVGHLGPVDHRDVVVEVERLDEPGLAPVDVDRAGVGGRVGARGVDGADHAPGGALDQRDRAAAARADVGEGVGRLGVGPVPPLRPAPEPPRLGELVEQVAGARPEEIAARPRAAAPPGRRRTGAGRGRRGSRGRRRSARRPGRAAPPGA